MTNNEIQGVRSDQNDPRVATVLAVHLVRQVLDEAYIIANAAHDSGQPWQYVSGLRKMRRCNLNETYEADSTALPLLTFNKKYYEAKLFQTTSKVATSTPQKVSGHSTSLNEHTLIGQGDEEYNMDTDESKSTSLFITNLFDMSDVERDLNITEPDLIQEKVEPNNLVMIAMKKIMDSFVDSAMDTVLDKEIKKESSPDMTITSSYSFLEDAEIDDVSEIENTLDFKTEETQIATSSKQVPDQSETPNKQDFVRYEKAFLTLNLSKILLGDEQYSEDDDEPVLQDPKGLSLQEIELMTRGSSGDIMPDAKVMKNKEFAAISGVSSAGLVSKKSSIVRCCRTQGARLLACLRGWWWRRKLPGKRREARMHGSKRVVCPLSPDTRRRAASLLDQRRLRSPSPSQSVIWKFNTINEALVHSAHWKEFSSNMDCN
ncbi:unnamed protein product [Leptosia nina]|uniref:Uncharacterized protein n=1 Tax=Leptosia nina TaxID=320188 RepID=A0AAV1J766_9NEOP